MFLLVWPMHASNCKSLHCFLYHYLSFLLLLVFHTTPFHFSTLIFASSYLHKIRVIHS